MSAGSVWKVQTLSFPFLLVYLFHPYTFLVEAAGKAFLAHGMTLCFVIPRRGLVPLTLEEHSLDKVFLCWAMSRTAVLRETL